MLDGASDAVGGSPVAVQRGLRGPKEDIPFWRAPWEFAVHGIVGTAIFAIIAALAVGLDLFVRWLGTSYRVSVLIVFGLRTAEYVLFVTDVCLFGVFLWRTAKRTIEHL